MDYKNILRILLGLPETATDSEIETAAKEVAAKVGNVGAVIAFSAARKKLEDSADAEVARQMGNSAESVKKFGAKFRA